MSEIPKNKGTIQFGVPPATSAKPSSNLREFVLAKLSQSESPFDQSFDKIFPEQIKALSGIHWTPVEAAKKAAQFCVRKPNDKVLDVGSGAGKFCLIGALTTPGIFTGIEQRERLAHLSSGLAEALEIIRIEFIAANALEVDWKPFDALYFFNPFYEHADPSIRIDDSVSLSPRIGMEYILASQRKLAEQPSGARVVTLNGMGGKIPDVYKLVHSEELGFIQLEVWDRV